MFIQSSRDPIFHDSKNKECSMSVYGLPGLVSIPLPTTPLSLSFPTVVGFGTFLSQCLTKLVPQMGPNSDEMEPHYSRIYVSLNVNMAVVPPLQHCVKLVPQSLRQQNFIY